ncbi:MAG: N-acetylneuraminate synthase [Chitinophagales bacterium]|nr:N-acetylneuraminate synthase [Chitinophagales bacterium]
MNKKQVTIIAEAGVNHNGILENALQLIEVAATAGADFVKFQTFKANKIVSPTAMKADYQKKNMDDGDNSQYNMLKSLEIPDFWYPLLLAHCKKHAVQFLSTGFDEESIDFLESFDPPFYKIPSGELTNLPYLIHIAKKNKPVILSTGMATIEEINDAINVFLKYGIEKSKITVLHCNTEYPTPMQDVNLKAMLHIQDILGTQIGYSDHTRGIEIPIAAVALGACVIEKHFTLDTNMLGPDHAASLTPTELISMVAAIRNVELAIDGDGIKQPSPSESKNIAIARKSIHINKSLNKGHTISAQDLIMLRPGNGISPMEMEKVIGKKINRDIFAGELLTFKDISE